MYFNQELRQKALGDIGVTNYVVSNWIQGDTWFFEKPDNFEKWVGLDQLIQRDVPPNVSDWVDDNYPQAPEMGPMPPIDNSTAHMGMVAFAITVISAISISVVLHPMMGLLTIPGLFLFWNFAMSERTTPEEQLQKHKRAYEETLKQWARQRQHFEDSLVEDFRKQIGEGIAKALGVPERLLREFSDWILENGSHTKPELEHKLQEWINQPEFPIAPSPTPGGVSHQEYENYCQLLLQSWGYLDAEVTRFVKDGGIDVESQDLIVQCKHIRGNVSAPEVQAIFGIAAQKSKRAVVFSAGGFTKDAIAFANSAEVALFHLREEEGKARALNQAATAVARAKKSSWEAQLDMNAHQRTGGLVKRLRGALGESPER